MNFGILLTKTINYNNIIDSKKNFIKKINKYKENKEQEQDDILEKINYYNNHYQKKREINHETYMNYIQSFRQLKDNWIKSNKVPITTSRKLTIVENMINWFADPIREEYEKAAKMKRILDKIKK